MNFRAFCIKYRGRLLALGISLVIILLYFLLRPWKAGMNFLIQQVTTPFKQGISWTCSILPFSAAELVWALLILGGIFLLGQSVWLLIRKKNRGELLLRRTAGLAAILAAGYAGFCLLWGVNYYGDSFSDQSGLQAEPITVSRLAGTARLFADLVNQYAPLTKRDENGLLDISRSEILKQTDHLYDSIGEEFPFLLLDMPRPKTILCSRVMSLVNFTGFYFPFTGEANLNADSPTCFFPCTAAHEMAHQRNIAPEQEATFVAILTCLKSDIPEFQYSGALMGYLYLANALYDADRDAWREVSGMLGTEAQADLSANNAYWAQFKTPVNTAAETVYNSFLQGYGQELGTKSYGACVDLLAAYFAEETSS